MPPIEEISGTFLPLAASVLFREFFCDIICICPDFFVTLQLI